MCQGSRGLLQRAALQASQKDARSSVANNYRIVCLRRHFFLTFIGCMGGLEPQTRWLMFLLLYSF